MSAILAPRLTARGLNLDRDASAFGPLRESIDVVNDAIELRNRLAQDGYLFLPGLLADVTQTFMPAGFRAAFFGVVQKQLSKRRHIISV